MRHFQEEHLQPLRETETEETDLEVAYLLETSVQVVSRLIPRVAWEMFL